MFPAGSATQKTAILGWQIVELHMHTLCLIQVARKDMVWVVDMWKVRVFPPELRHILELPNIKKVGVGLIKNINIVWDDLQFNMKHLVDVGMMAKLALAEK
ncbi:hypothetical protein C8R44DRAFT_735622 [Mycena epipterygia]|nr:hypothetical protein C8R44DRAFT_735622 [Mycena epipterygia]